MDPVVHFEMPYDDRERIARFYQSVFGWKLQMMGEDMGNYVLASTAERDLMPEGKAFRGAIDGGFFPRSPDMPGQHPSVVAACRTSGVMKRSTRRAAGARRPCRSPASGSTWRSTTRAQSSEHAATADAGGAPPARVRRS
jgi:predicted enzyme related to lactoylglutathione lyase